MKNTIEYCMVGHELTIGTSLFECETNDAFELVKTLAKGSRARASDNRYNLNASITDYGYSIEFDCGTINENLLAQLLDLLRYNE